MTGVGGPVLLLATGPELERGDVLAGRYQIEALIGTGGSGRVLRAFDRVAREPVALKILRPEYASDPLWTERFSRELRVGRQIQHKNVCRIFDIGEADGHRFLSMELATRGTVRAQLGGAALARPLDQRIADARAVVEGAAALHAAGIVHRDLKPENLLRMEDGRLVVSDFGLATDPGSGPTTTIMVGTPRYMAAEVVMGDPATSRSDVWALGIVMHEILFGVRPDFSVVRRGTRRFTAPALASARERRLAELCGRCADDDPRARPASAIEVRREFEAAALGRRSRHTHNSRQMVWGAVAIAALAALGVVRDRWSNRAVASSSQVAGALSGRVLKATGTPADWRAASTRIAAFSGRVHCLELLDAGRTLRGVWGAPRLAEDIDLRSGQRTPAPLVAATYADGCPRTSADGKRILYTRVDEGGSYIFMSSAPDGSAGKQVVRGAMPEWLPNGQEFVFSADSRHAAIFSVPTGEMTLVTDGDNTGRHLGDLAIDQSGTRLAIRYTTDSTDNLVVVHSLPGLKVLGRAYVPVLSAHLQFTRLGKLLLMADGSNGLAETAELHLGTSPGLRRIGRLPEADVTGMVEGAGSLFIVGHQQRRDLWVRNATGVSRLTWDGVSIHGALSAGGVLVIQRLLSDGRLVMVQRHRDGTEKQVTQGPLDTTPAFAQTTPNWFYSELDRGRISQCSGDNGVCSVVHHDPLLPGFPSPDPSDQQIAYLTLMNVPRLRLVSLRDGRMRDLGPAGGDECRPLWTSATRLWVAQAPISSTTTWVEFDVPRGERTGRHLPAKLSAGRRCGVPDDLAPATGAADVFAISAENAEIRRIAASGRI